MVSAKLVHQIEDHWEAISTRLLRLLRTCPGLPHFNHIPESEVTEVCRRVLHNLGHWLVSTSDDELAQYYERIGRQRHKEGMPLSECLRSVQLMREATFDYVRDESTIQSSMDLYAEEELETRLARFFDLLAYHLARGYEQAQNLHVTN
jgi:hypothetical protein